MGNKRIVIALGGNALENGKGAGGADAQLEVVRETCRHIADISCAGYEIGIVHGNGPQVGRILLASETASEVTPAMPFDVCGAMSQGYIGYHIQQALRHELEKRKRNIPVVTIATQTVVNKNDVAFSNPTKPIGPFYSEEEARDMEKEKGYVMKEDAGRGYRRVVPSPAPERIVEIDAVKTLWDSTITISCGGGGIPVVENADGGYEGVAAVIDKDFAAGLLADNIGADVFMILTAVPAVSINFGKPEEKELGRITPEEAEKYIAEGHFAPGSMLPKVQAAVKFVKDNPSKEAVITSLDNAGKALRNGKGTVISYRQ
ncbi:MAG: carbamate kinase [Firmicutes bacterium]|nr:carbamate kinase [Bacillota bacterium]MBQ9972438.1 carbamate kinase [Bacillota bacterium]